MAKLDKLIAEITGLTLELETSYPSIYRFLEEQEVTLPTFEHPEMTEKIFTEYLENLKQLLFRYKQSHLK
ncbi:hypothetical protein SAMN04487764_3032 [Gillisia sp. Hel1_33_143]|uniref:hypothetical protein n=1 Tax=unclassified Gillisia TaxID=2615025 RepID=UPI00055059EB|nr:MULTISPECIES: hypothetical protein [unclassified Gillisia]SDS77707.1 hypothetical protein SAMN04487764_3032 [Gillisia sp. Hel1_33_143]